MTTGNMSFEKPNKKEDELEKMKAKVRGLTQSLNAEQDLAGGGEYLPNPDEDEDLKDNRIEGIAA